MTPPAIRAVIFDCDGTLVDSETISMEVLLERVSALESAAEGTQEGTQRVSITHAEAMTRFAGNDLKVVFKELESLMSVSLPEDFLSEFRRHQLAALAERLRPVDGAMELLASMAMPFCVASNAPQQKIRLCLESTTLIQHCDPKLIFSAYDVQAWKPDPKLFLASAKELKVAPEECVVVEDSVFGIEAGHNAGMRVIAFDPHQSLPRGFANTTYVSHLDEVPGALATISA